MCSRTTNRVERAVDVMTGGGGGAGAVGLVELLEQELPVAKPARTAHESPRDRVTKSDVDYYFQ